MEHIQNIDIQQIISIIWSGIQWIISQIDFNKLWKSLHMTPAMTMLAKYVIISYFFSPLLLGRRAKFSIDNLALFWSLSPYITAVCLFLFGCKAVKWLYSLFKKVRALWIG